MPSTLETLSCLPSLDERSRTILQVNPQLSTHINPNCLTKVLDLLQAKIWSARFYFEVSFINFVILSLQARSL